MSWLIRLLYRNQQPKAEYMKIWMEGYRITGNESKAQILGEGKGSTLTEVVADWKENNPESAAQYLTEKEDGTFQYWGCRLFDNEKDARVSFG